MTFVRTKLGVVDAPLPGASILKGATLPLLRGNEPEDLLCGGCEAVLGKSISGSTLKQRMAAPVQLIAICPKCGANNVLPSTIHVEK